MNTFTVPRIQQEWIDNAVEQGRCHYPCTFTLSDSSDALSPVIAWGIQDCDGHGRGRTHVYALFTSQMQGQPALRIETAQKLTAKAIKALIALGIRDVKMVQGGGCYEEATQHAFWETWLRENG